MIGVISLLGIQSLQDELAKKLEKSGIVFLCPDCGNDVVLLEELGKRTHEADVILLNSGVLNMRSMDGVLSEIRGLSESVRIILILSGSRKQYISVQLDQYKNRYMVSDMMFEGSGIHIEELTNIIVKGRMTEHEVLIHSELAEEYEKTQKEMDGNTIAVFGITHGAGTTSMAVSIAEYFALFGKIVKVVDLTGSASLAFTRGKAIYLTQKRQDLKEVKATSDFVVYDFGVPFCISPYGDFQGVASGYSTELIYELKNCSLKVGMGFLDDWHIKKTEYFFTDEKWKRIIGNEYLFLFDNDPSELKSKYPHINMFGRNDESLADIVGKLFLDEE